VRGENKTVRGRGVTNSKRMLRLECCFCFAASALEAYTHKHTPKTKRGAACHDVLRSEAARGEVCIASVKVTKM
jgi:hypothetical protein